MKLRKKTTLPVILLAVMVITLLVKNMAAEINPSGQKILHAFPINERIHVDGLLNEGAWKNPGTGDFIQSEPVDGVPATEKTIVWVGFDDEALYIAARMSDSQPGKIIGRLGRRDDWVDSDWFVFAVDPYYDHRSGYQFAVNPSGSIVDTTLYNDERNDDTWDGIWESAAKIHDNGWSVELRIPYHQLRFKKNGAQQYTWGINFQRIIKRKNEVDVFAWTPKEESGYVSRFARLEGIRSIDPGRHIEVQPYSTGKAAFTTRESGNILRKESDFNANGGLDVKVGLKSNLILDMSVNPDFGQVEVDPAVINLTASETFYEEKRPFFIEGANIFHFGAGGASYHSGFGWINPLFFYSRRIGHSPQQTGNNTVSTILTAAKVTGKIAGGWNVGLLNAFTEKKSIVSQVEGEPEQKEILPFSYYGVLRIQKEFNEGRQGLGFITTGILRRLHTPYLEETMSRKVFSLGMDGWTFLNRKKSWVLSSWFGGTSVFGSSTFITHLQHSYLHYFQRPDASHLDLDPGAVSMNGWGGRIYLTKQGGNVIFNASLGAISPGFDVNNMGYQDIGDVINSHIQAGYVSLHPGKIFRQWHFVFASALGYDFGGNKIDNPLFFQASAQLLNYWQGNITLLHNPGRLSKTFTRGGPLTLAPSYTETSVGITSDNRKPLVLDLFARYSSQASGDEQWSGSIALKWKPASNISLSVEPAYTFNYPKAQWVTSVRDSLMIQTYGTRYIYSPMVQETLSCSIRINWIFSPRLSLQAYIQPYISVGDYDGFKELAQPRSFDFNCFGKNGSGISYQSGEYIVDPDGSGPASSFSFSNPDFNYKSLRGTIVLRWEYNPGSTLYAVWTQNRDDYSHPGDFRLGRDLGALFRASGDNIFMVKITYRFRL